MKNKKTISLFILTLLAIATVGSFTACASTTNANTSAEKVDDKRFERPQNEILGKITSISENSVTISLAERKMPDRDGEKFKEPPKENAENKDNAEKPNFDDFFTLTGESKTIDISSASFEGFRGRGKNDKDSEENTSKTKTYADYSVGDYIMIELTSETSSTAKTVRDANMFRGFEKGGPRGQRDEKDGKDRGFKDKK